jgi:PhoH-like ATPase
MNTTNTEPRKSPTKTYVLDTNVLLHDPESIFNFDEHRVVLPVEVLSELDRKKTKPGALGANARSVNRYLRELFSEALKNAKAGAQLIAQYEVEGELRVVVKEHLKTPSEAIQTNLKNTLISLSEPDHRILATALYIQNEYMGTDPDHEVIMVTKDSNMALKGMALGLKVEDYLTDSIQGEDSDEVRVLTLENPQELELLISKPDARLFIPGPDSADILINEYVILECEGIQEPARHIGDGIFLNLPIYREFCDKGSDARTGLQLPRGNRVIPRNLEQWIFMDALLNPEIALVTVRGKAGTGKTFIAIATALSEVLSSRSPYKHCYISRPVVNMGKDLGALPGEKEDKMAPYIQPYFDNLEALFGKKRNTESGTRTDDRTQTASKTSQKKSKKQPQIFKGSKPQGQQPPQKPYQWLLDTGAVEIEALTFIRGRSIADSYMIVDEAQNLTPHEVKTLVTRMGEGSKLILMGDPAQIDSAFLDSTSNGLVLVRERMSNLPLAAHVSLVEGVRSPLSDAAADLL